MSIEHPPNEKTAHGTPKEELGARLRLLRRRTKLTQAQVATELGVTKQAVSNWEKGLHEPHRKHKRELASLFGVTVEETSRRYDFMPENSETQPYRRTDLDRMKLIEARHSLGLTQRQAAERAALSKPAVCRYETGARLPSVDAMLRLAAAYGKPLHWFMNAPTGTGPPAPA